MNKLIDELFEKESFLKIVSVITAILIWFVVLDSNNPFEERIITVPLSTNVELLQIKHLQIVGSSLPSSVDIKIKGRRHKIADVVANDFKVWLDLSEISESGNNTISIDAPEYFGSQDIIILGMSPSTVSVELERIVGKQYPVEVIFTGSLPNNYEILNLRVEPNIAILEEKESSIAQVSRIVAYVNLDEADNNKELVMRATALDTDGNSIKQFDGRVPVIVSYNLAKSIPVSVNVSGNLMNDYFLEKINYSLPSVRIIGSRSVLDGIKTLNAQPIDISDKNESFIAPIVFNLPTDTTLMPEDGERISAEIIIGQLITKDFNLPKSVVTISPATNLDNNEYKITDHNIPITIKGRPDELEGMTNNHIRLSVEVNDLEPGEHEVPLIVRVPGTAKVVGEYSVSVVVTAIPETEPNNPDH